MVGFYDRYKHNLFDEYDLQESFVFRLRPRSITSDAERWRRATAPARDLIRTMEIETFPAAGQQFLPPRARPAQSARLQRG